MNPYSLIGELYEGIKIVRVNAAINWVKLDGQYREFYLVELENNDWVRYWREDLWKRK